MYMYTHIKRSLHAHSFAGAAQVLQSTPDGTEIGEEPKKIPRPSFEVPEELLRSRDKSPAHSNPIASDALSSSQSSNRSSHSSGAVKCAKIKGTYTYWLCKNMEHMMTQSVHCVVQGTYVNSILRTVLQRWMRKWTPTMWRS